MVSQPQKFQVVIVGAGLSGLRAATEIHAAGLSYVVLEAMDRAGGKILSVPSRDDGTALIDVGAAWINDTNQSEMYALAQKYGFELVKQRAEGRTLYQDAEGNVSVLPYGSPAKLTPEQQKEFDEIAYKVGEYVERSNLENPHLGPDAAELDSLTIAQFAEKKFGGTLVARLFFTELAKGLVGAKPEEISALHLVDYIKSGGGLAIMMSDDKHGSQYLRNRQGQQQFAKNLAAELHPGTVKLSHPVKSITQSDDCVLVSTANGKQFTADRVIVSIPTPLYSRIHFEPELPPAKKALGDSNKLGCYSKTVFVFSSAWWRDADLSGTVNSPGLITFSRDTVVPEDEQYSITCFHLGAPGLEWSKFQGQEKQDAVWREFHKMFSVVVDKVPEPIKVIQQDWTLEPWAWGAPSPFMVPGIMSGEPGQAIRDPVGRIHFVGSETAPVWKGYMERAVRSGLRGAMEVIQAVA
ncbi:Amine oxidase [Fusarium sp. Ph1]|nr:Amine oxidase [Fusarium sp. Ph1]